MVELAFALLHALLWAGGAGIDPCAHKLTEELLRTRRRVTAFAGLPAPRNEIVLGEVLVQELQASAAVSLRIF